MFQEIDVSTATGNVLAHYRQVAQQKEEIFLFNKASFSKNHSRLERLKSDHWLPYKHDVDCILHSKAYSRYVDKTQVVYLVNNAHLTHRSLHVQLVSNFARQIAEILCLNLDLVEAISLGHDVGHSPFGHEGENYLSDLSIEYGNGPFSHPLQSCRLFTDIEPLNLGLAVYDGFLSHDGGLLGHILIPKFDKSWDDHFQDRKQKKSHPNCNISPTTLEGCLVKLCDTISYLGRDIEDAINLGILQKEDVPKTFLGTTNQEILSTLAADIIRHSYHKEYISISEEASNALRILRHFNFQHIYSHPKLKVESFKIKYSYRIVFEYLLQNLKRQEEQSYLWEHFLSQQSEKYLSNTSQVQMVVDYIAGMTDHFFLSVLEHIFIPSKIQVG